MEKQSETSRQAFAPCLTLKEVSPAVEFYKRAFGVQEVLIVKNDDGSVHVAELAFEGMTFHLHQEMTGSANRAPAGSTTVELGVFLDNPDRLMDSALAAGATLVNPMRDHSYGYRQGSFMDPFGHFWTLQKKLPGAWEGVIGPDGEKEK